MSELRIDVPVLRKALEWASAEDAKERPSGREARWDQSSYGYGVLVDGVVCGTTGCIAWHLVTQAPGYVIDYQGPNPAARLNDDPAVVRVWAGAVSCPDGEYRSVADAARNIAGLRQMQADELFAGCNDVADLWRIANRITRGAIEIPVEHQ